MEEKLLHLWVSLLKKSRNAWSMVGSAIGGNDPIYAKVLRAVKTKKDHVMLARLGGVSNGDLVAVEARYNRKKLCLLNYIKNVPQLVSSVSQTLQPTITLMLSIFERTFLEQIMREKKVFLLSTIRREINYQLREVGINEAYR